MFNNKQIAVLFVCLGNICRSPMAEAVFRHLVTQEKMQDLIHIDSAGTGNWHAGKPPHHGTRDILDKYSISYKGQTARQIAKEDFSNFDYIVAMDNQNEQDLRNIVVKPTAQIIKLLDLVPDSVAKEVPDPYYTGNFDEVYEMVDKGCRALLNLICKEFDIGKVK